MFTVYYEEYHNDYHRKNHIKYSLNLNELEEWIFGQMKQNYSDKKSHAMYFPEGASEIEFIPEYGGPRYWIHMIKNEKGILFSDGKMTDNQKHISKQIEEWCHHCKERQYAPKFAFIE